MNYPATEAILSQVQEALERDDLNRAIHILQALKPVDQAEVFEDLDDEDQVSLLPNLETDVSADILEYLEDEDAARLAASLSEDDVVRIVNEMEPDEAADLLGDIQPSQAQAILAQLDNPEEVRPLLLHPDESAGGLMTSEYLALRRRMTVAEALQALRDWHPDRDWIYYLYVVDGQNRLSGVVSPRQLIVSDPGELIMDIMDTDFISVKAGEDQEKVAEVMSRYDLLALPVVDDHNVLLGMITIDDVMDVVVEEATEDIQKLGGALPLDEPYLLTKAGSIVRKRIGWLMLLFVTESLTGTVLRHYEDELQVAVALAFFVPLLIGTGGNAGSQTTSTIIRALAVGEIHIRDWLRALWHESRVGLLLGVGMAALAYLRALTWGSSSALSLTVAIAVLSIVIWANVLGAVLPIAAQRFKIDPTVVSGPVMSTLVDATGLFIYFSIARFIMKL
ncbi:MAG: magnesium transporter [Anaerolineales bacterium]|jgi:magnesium transporter|nr:magnesium transporter [Anaerolineales bacterium]